MSHLETAREVIDVVYGGVPALAAKTDRLPATVYAWQSRDKSFPAELFTAMMADITALGHTADKSLWRQIDLLPSDDESLEETTDA